MINATIAAKKLKHAAAVLRELNDEAIFQIAPGGMMCQLIDPTNAMMGQIDIPSSAFDFYDAKETQMGIDLNKLTGMLKRASANDAIHITGDTNAWQFVRDIHQKTMGLLNPEKLRKVPDRFELLHTVSVRLSGKQFKEIVAEAADVSDHVLFRATADALTIEAENNDMNPERYKCTLPAAQYYERYESNALALYSLEDMLAAIAADMKASDDVLFQFATDKPCEIEYERDGVNVWFMLAPRIESE